jgi:deoxycytidine triphosphate deaminase
MILTGPEIVDQHRKRRILIDPFDADAVNPNSYNFRLGNKLKVYDTFPVDPKVPNVCEEIDIPPAGYVLEAHRLYLGHTLERLGSPHYAPTFAARSSVARLGLFINLSASLGDIGFFGQWTLQLFPVHPLRLYPGMRIGQMMWWQPVGEIDLYQGKYQGSMGPASTLIHRDFAVLEEAAVGQRSEGLEVAG